MIRKDFGVISILDFGVKVDGKDDDSIAIQKAIDYASDKDYKVIFPKGEYSISQTILIKEGVELEFHRGAILSITANVKGFELESGAGISGGTIVIDDENYTSEVIYLDGKYRYDNDFSKPFVRDINIWNWSGTTGGIAVSLFSGGNTHHIHYVNMERVSIWNFDVGLRLRAADPGTGYAWVNANKFDMFTIAECRIMIETDSLEYPPYECSGNFFTNLQIQPGDNTEKLFVISGGANTFTGMIWDLHMIEHDDEVILFTEESSGNHIDIRDFPSDRVLNLGHNSNIVGAEGLLPISTYIENETNWDDIKTMGSYRIMNYNGMNTSLNHPDAYEYGTLIVINTFEPNSVQMYIPHDEDGMYIRSAWGEDNWTDWFIAGGSGGGGGGGNGFDEREEYFEGNWNLAMQMGTYRIQQEDDTFTEENNQPIGAATYGLLLVYTFNDQITQMYITYNNEIYSRSAYDMHDPEDWSDWVKLITSVDVGHYDSAMLPKDWVEEDKDWDTLLDMGAYFISQDDDSFTELNNQPVGAFTYGVLTVFNSGEATISQMYITHGDPKIYYRSCYDADDWTEWETLTTGSDVENLNESLLARDEDEYEINRNTDWNTLNRMGTYQISYDDELLNPLLNQPPSSTYGYGLLIVTRNVYSVVQMYITHLTNEMWIRSDYNEDDWTEWINISGGGGGTGGHAVIESLNADPVEPQVGRIWLRSDIIL